MPPSGKRGNGRRPTAPKKPRGVEPVVRRLRNLWKRVGEVEPARRDALYDLIAESVERLEGQVKRRMADMAARPINHHPLFQAKELIAEQDHAIQDGS